SLENRAFQPQEHLLAIEAAPVAGEAPVRADHAVARQDDRERIAVHDRAHRTSCARPLSASCQLAVRHDFAVRDARELSEYAAVELRQESNIDWKVERPSPPVEVLVQLATRRVDRLRRAQDADTEGPGEQLDL